MSNVAANETSERIATLKREIAARRAELHALEGSKEAPLPMGLAKRYAGQPWLHEVRAAVRGARWVGDARVYVGADALPILFARGSWFAAAQPLYTLGLSRFPGRPLGKESLDVRVPYFVFCAGHGRGVGQAAPRAFRETFAPSWVNGLLKLRVADRLAVVRDFYDADQGVRDAAIAAAALGGNVRAILRAAKGGR
jgi:hypothetical protein